MKLTKSLKLNQILLVLWGLGPMILVDLFKLFCLPYFSDELLAEKIDLILHGIIWINFTVFVIYLFATRKKHREQESV